MTTEAQPALHIYTAPTTRIRRLCPFHKHLCYGKGQEFYDTTRVFYDCGTLVDYGYGYWQIPQDEQRKRWREAKRRRQGRTL